MWHFDKFVHCRMGKSSNLTCIISHTFLAQTLKATLRNVQKYILTVVTMMYYRSHELIPLNFCPLTTISQISPSLSSGNQYFTVSMNLTFSHSTYKWDYVYLSVCLAFSFNTTSRSIHVVTKKSFKHSFPKKIHEWPISICKVKCYYLISTKYYQYESRSY